MDVAKEFTSRLRRDFNDRLRIRWSKKRGEWHIEQKVGRAALPPIYISEVDDDLIRAKDGYAFVMAIRPGDRMPCPDCGLTLRVPVMQIAETTCDYCRYKGRYGRHSAAYFPLGDLLIEHLKKISPERRPKKFTEMLDAKNAAVLASRQREFENEFEATTKENWSRMIGIPSWGYTGKEFRG
jgi:hypothetical protein